MQNLDLLLLSDEIETETQTVETEKTDAPFKTEIADDADEFLAELKEIFG